MLPLLWRGVANPRFTSKDGGSPFFGCPKLFIQYILSCPPSIRFQTDEVSCIGGGIQNHRADRSCGRITSEFHLDIEFRKRSRRSSLFQRSWQRKLSLSTRFRSARFYTHFVAGGFGTTEGDSSSGNIRIEEQGYGCARYSKYIYV
jgi:hypothetical protein